MNKKVVKITAIIIALIFALGIFGPLAYMYVFSAPTDEAETDYAKKLEAAEKLEARVIEESGERFRIMCERGISSYLDMIFSAESISDLNDRVVIANELMEYDKNMIEAVTEAKNRIAEAKASQESELNNENRGE